MTAKRAAKKMIILPTNSKQMASHLQIIIVSTCKNCKSFYRSKVINRLGQRLQDNHSTPSFAIPEDRENQRDGEREERRVGEVKHTPSPLNPS